MIVGRSGCHCDLNGIASYSVLSLERSTAVEGPCRFRAGMALPLDLWCRWLPLAGGLVFRILVIFVIFAVPVSQSAVDVGRGTRRRAIQLIWAKY